MLRLNFVFAICILLFLVIKPNIYALVINEVYPAPVSGNYEWVELFNNENEDVDLSKYRLTDEKDKKINIIDSTIISNGYTIATASNVLNNSGDTVYLKNGEDIIDTVGYSGSYTSDYVYARCPDGGNWIKLGSKSPGASNTTICPTIPPTENPNIITLQISPNPTQPPIKPSPTRNPTTKPQIYDNIYISEVFPRPSDGPEWVELYNDNDYSVILTNWAIDDIEDGGSNPVRFSTSISKGGYYILEFAKHILNNSGDNVRLLDFEETEIDLISYGHAEVDKSFGRVDFDSNNVCLQNASKKKNNTPCIRESYNSPSRPESISKNATPTPPPENPTIEATKDPGEKIEYVFVTTGQAQDEIEKKKVLGAISKKQKDKPLKYKQEIIYLSSGVIFLSGFNIIYILYKIDKKMKLKQPPGLNHT